MFGLTNDIELNDMKLLKCTHFFYRNGHASLRVVFNNKFYGVNSPIFHKTYSKMAFLVDNLIINKSLSTRLHYTIKKLQTMFCMFIPNCKKITNNVLYVHT